MSDEQDEARDTFPDPPRNGRATSPTATSGLRQRPLGRAATFAEAAPRTLRRESSFVSESLSESRRSLWESTDDLLLPRAFTSHDTISESSNWHSLPLGLALLPAVGGLFFQNGSAFITDISLLAIAALFLNWSVRLPWDWYLSAQALVAETEPQDLGSAIDDEASDADTEVSPSRKPTDKAVLSDHALSAQNELRIHELLALFTCFAFPAAGAWLLHAIRSQLTHRSEGLVSDYNLTIFLLAAEVRPLSHLLKLVQRRTLFLQRTITVASTEHIPDQQVDSRVSELRKRLEDLESHVAGSVLLSASPASRSQPGTPSQTSADDLVSRASTQAQNAIRNTLQPELDALNRAMRRYEKGRMTQAIQVETRLQELEGRVQDVVILAAATQRNADRREGRHHYSAVLLNWLSATVVVPVQYGIWVLTLPQRTLSAMLDWVRKKLGFKSAVSKGRDGRAPLAKGGQGRRKSKERVKA